MPPLTLRIAQRVETLLAGEGTGHDWHHVERVARLARLLAGKEGADLETVELAALLHDVADWKFQDGDASAGPREAARILEEEGAPADQIRHVAEIIETMSFKGAGVPTPMRTLEGRVVQDADRLDALGAVGIARCFAYGGWKGTPIHDPELPPTPHASFEAYKSAKNTSLNHFHEKLYLLPERMNTAYARDLAEERVRFMKAFEARFLAEWAGATPET